MTDEDKHLVDQREEGDADGPEGGNNVIRRNAVRNRQNCGKPVFCRIEYLQLCVSLKVAVYCFPDNQLTILYQNAPKSSSNFAIAQFSHELTWGLNFGMIGIAG